MDVDARIDELTKRRDEAFSKITKARASETSSSPIPSPYEASSSLLKTLISHTQGKLPSYKPNLETASETAPDNVVSENQQPPETQLEMASELCIAIIIHPLFKPDSPLNSVSHTTSSEPKIQTVSDTPSSVSEDQTSFVQPLNVAQSNKVDHNAFVSFFNRQSESILEHVSNQASVRNTSDNLLSYDFEDEDVTIIFADSNHDTPSTSTSKINQDLPTPLVTEPINVSPPPSLLIQSTILREVCENIFEDLIKLVQSRNDPIHTENY